ncbi:C40 family peptidase [Noviherbaspirillum galbum]|uniref:C40 family peptidase n=1 Tax=Noviherbaspirillum galbum TaxID=2709383 RepID=A0A6B3SP22_9BURK|nr:C40 family peptidase [Noviherbaspirillum galbum]NEX62248.1 C40 family peptidase [Noviherbaspirillum galbum]
MIAPPFRLLALTLSAAALIAGCGTPPPGAPASDTRALASQRPASPEAQDIALTALSLLRTGYRFGGKNPEAGLDCSGFVTYVYQLALGRQLAGNAASLARQGKEIPRQQLQAGDLVFFNTLGRPYSHVGIYLGSDEFIHAPNSRGTVRVDKLTNAYYASRFETARTLLD